LVFAIVVAVALTAAGCSSDSSEPTVPELTVDGALAVSDGFIEAFNAGDAEAVLALLTSDVALSERFPGVEVGPSFEALDSAFFEQHLAWTTAQGTTFTSPECAVTDEGTGATVTVSCEFGWLDAAEAAVGLPPVPTVLTMVVTKSGISEAAFEYLDDFGPGSFGAGSDGSGSFDVWVVANHADHMEGVEFGDWDSVAVAEQGGILLALYVEEWAAFLETRG
jgi:ketosteroid isomerase-like protein